MQNRLLRNCIFLTFILMVSGTQCIPKVSAKEIRNCNGESFYVILAKSTFCIPASFKPFLSLLSQRIKSGDYSEAKTNFEPLPVEFIYFDLVDQDKLQNLTGSESAEIQPLLGIRLSFEKDKVAIFKQKSMELEQKISSQWKYDYVETKGLFKKIEERQFMKADNKWVLTNTYYLRIPDQYLPEQKRYYYRCDIDCLTPLGEQKSPNYAVGHDCWSTSISLSNGLFTEIRFHDASFPVEKWHLWEDTLEKLIMKIQVEK